MAGGRRIGVPDTHLAGPRVARWLPAGNVVLAAIAMLIAVGGSVLFETLGMRIGVTVAVAIAGVGEEEAEAVGAAEKAGWSMSARPTA